MEISNREIYFQYKDKEFFNDTIIYELLCFCNGFESFSKLVINFDEFIKDYDKFLELSKKIEEGVPLQYVLGFTFFSNLKITINNNVLIPRPETVELCDKMYEIITKNNLNHDNIGDICTGSGCIGLYFKDKFKDSNVYCTDISSKALEVAKVNSKNLNLKINLKEGNIVDPLIKENIKLDVLISNPPYVENMDDIDDIVKNNEPMNAVYSKDGTYFYEEIFKKHKEVTNEKALLGFEINYDQEEKLTKLIKKYFNDDVKFNFYKDFDDKIRFLIIYKGY